MARRYPVVGCSYPLHEIIKALDLDDSPHLGFTLEGRHGVIQESHLTEDELLAVPKMAETRWRYVRRTHEWIPVFTLADDNEVPLREVLDLEPTVDDTFPERNATSWWATPKGHPRKQFSRED